MDGEHRNGSAASPRERFSGLRNLEPDELFVLRVRGRSFLTQRRYGIQRTTTGWRGAVWTAAGVLWRGVERAEPIAAYRDVEHEFVTDAREAGEL